VYPLAKFSKIWQTGIGSKIWQTGIGSKYLIIRANFSGISTKPVFTAVKDKFAKIINCLYKPYFLCLKFVYYEINVCCENFGNFYQREFKKIFM